MLKLSQLSSGYLFLCSPPFLEDRPSAVKLDSRETPPPLHFSPATSDRDRSSTAEPTPIGTPIGFSAPYTRRSEREKDLLFSWHRKPGDIYAYTSSAYADSELLDTDLEDSPFPLFGQSPPQGMARPFDIATRNSPPSPRNSQTSNLTSALHATTGNGPPSSTAMNMNGGKSRPYNFARPESENGNVPFSTQYGSGAQPIAMNGSSRERPRRESLGGSLVGGMSWGGVSVGSWIRDEYVPFSLEIVAHYVLIRLMVF